MTMIWQGRFDKRPGDPKFCRASVYSREAGQILSQSYQCSRKMACTRVIDGKEYGFCNQHDPEMVRSKDEIRIKQWRLENEARKLEHTRQEQIKVAMEACKVAIERIAAGYDCPMNLALETLELFPK